MGQGTIREAFMTTPPQHPNFVSIGVSGGIGSGKSTVAREICATLNAQHINADDIVSDLLQREGIVNKIISALGQDVCDEMGALNRTKLGSMVFRDESSRLLLEQILHPEVREIIFAEISFLAKQQPNLVVMLDIPLLHEGGLEKLCDFVVFVDTPEEQRSARACERHGWSIEHWQAREKMQMPIASKKSLADAILCNDSSLSALREQVELLVPHLKSLKPRTLSSRWPEN
ncbi:MAG: dephospho-CoA kinase [Planctomycetes bacterium]|nr:dephospho-CoA kinase [Planctomycetota bacterium]